MSGPSLTDGIAASLRHLSQRQQVIAQNIANADTPGFKARELEASGFGAMVEGMVARPHIELSPQMKALGARTRHGGMIEDRDVSETKPDGNNVTLEDQLLKIGQIQADFATMTNLYRKQMGLLKTALGKGHGG